MKLGNVLILGGTGFLGHKLVSAFLQTKRYGVIVPYRQRPSPKDWLPENIQENPYLKLIEFSDDLLMRLLEQETVNPADLLLAVSLIGKSKGRDSEISESNLGHVSSLIALFRLLKAKNHQMVTVHFGSIAEYKKYGELSLYARLKREARRRLEDSGVCDLIVTHSILDDNKEKIAADLEPVLADIERSSYLLDRVVLSTISSSFLCRAFIHFVEYYLSQDNVRSDSELVILEREQSLRQFLTSIFNRTFDSRPTSHNTENRYLDHLTELVNEKLALNNTLRTRMLSFIDIARIDDPTEREKQNHYLRFGRVSDFRKLGNIRSVLFSRNDLICLSIENKYIVCPERLPFVARDTNDHERTILPWN